MPLYLGSSRIASLHIGENEQKAYNTGYSAGDKNGYYRGYNRGYEEGEAAGSGSGGLPAGITALASGTFTFSTDQTSKPSISHGLGTMPNFFIVLAEGEPLAAEDFVQYCVSQFSVTQSYTDISSASTQQCYNIIRYGLSSGKFAETKTYSSVFTSFADDSAFYPYAGTGQKLKAGVTYRWIAGVVEGI